ncbi:protein kinase C-binding protein NELL2 [Strongylocentrotus purpuratus]|uniref:Uncharacterized protein n=1 Tax=Strongylocentrotus purpuratus TaxID=7668 RepID=A0A7M7NZB5_STRPU|nr:protein kinase C-binding protein NELL2 [Strongylocentrotus purpuratus]
MSTMIGIMVAVCCLFTTVHSIGVDPSLEVDLIQGVYMSAVDSPDVTQVAGHPHSYGPAFNFEGESRTIEANEETYQKLKNLLSGRVPEFTVIATVNQKKRNSGSIMSITVGRIRYMEIFASTRNHEFRLYYTHNGQVLTESIPYPFKAETWYKLAVTVSGSQLKLSVDCQENTTRQIRLPDLDFDKPGLKVYVGQRSDRTYFKGILQDVKLIASAQGFVAQCPYMGRSCPTCAEYHTMVETITRLDNLLHQMELKFQVAEARIDELESCSCVKGCQVNGEHMEHSAQWTEDCLDCTCESGHVSCNPVACAPVYCKNPIYQPGNCCPICKANCTVSGVTYHHGDVFQQKTSRGALQICSVKECNNGGTVTQRQDSVSNMCPTPSCAVSERFTVPGSCCEYCQGTDYCAQGHSCVSPKVCVNTPTSSECLCPTGYLEANGNCTDINECVVSETQPDPHCYEGTLCVNTPGGYQCGCKPGYETVTDTQCRQIDECTAGTDNCDENADCTDTDGSFTCTCQHRYHGDGTYCFPVCSKVCQNGGVCIRPSVCECPPGYEGDACEMDKDECTNGESQCTGQSHCVNLPGSYHCDCDSGYYSQTAHVDYGASCTDIDECETSNTCDKSRLCINDEGSYECRCSAASSCSTACRTDWGKKGNGATWDTHLCQTCTCQVGVVTCTPQVCDCTDPEIDPVCCPMCVAEIQQCLHQSSAITYNHREWWNHDCKDCQCLEGSIKCKPVQCEALNCPSVYTPVDECCPRCQPHNECDLMTPGPKVSSPSTCITDLGVVYSHKERWFLDEDQCTECVCQNGNICCAYNSACAP